MVSMRIQSPSATVCDLWGLLFFVFFKSWYIEGCVINMTIKYNPNKDINLQCKNGEKIFNIHINIYTR